MPSPARNVARYEVGQTGAAALLSCITFSIPMFSLYEPSTVSEVGQTGSAALLAFLAH